MKQLLLPYNEIPIGSLFTWTNSLNTNPTVWRKLGCRTYRVEKCTAAIHLGKIGHMSSLNGALFYVFPKDTL